MPKLFDVVKAAGQYQDAQGQTKTRWIKCGMIIKNQNGKMALKLDALPLGTPVDGDGGIWFALMDPNRQQGQPQPVPNSGYPQQAQPVPTMPPQGHAAPPPQGHAMPAPAGAGDGFTDDDIPF